MESSSKATSSLFIDVFCALSLVGIWPRFIEPKRLTKTSLKWLLTKEHSHLAGLRIVQLTDLHFHDRFPLRFLNKILKQVNQLNPDLILMTGDFICYSQLNKAESLKAFLTHLKAPLGKYCVFGNHDYAQYVSRDADGIYDVLPPTSPIAGLLKGIKTLFSSRKAIVKKGYSNQISGIGSHQGLSNLIREAGFIVLENESVSLNCGLTLIGVGEYALNKCDPKKAFQNIDKKHLKLTLVHNPDALLSLLAYPSDWFLAGHTHGEQIHFPSPAFLRHLSKKLTRLDNLDYTRGFYKALGKNIYVSRGLGCHKPFRLFSPPEIVSIDLTLENS